MRSEVKVLFVVCAVVMTTLVIHDHSRVRTNTEPLLGQFSSLISLTPGQVNTSTDDATLQLDDEKLKMLSSLTKEEMDELLDKISAPKPPSRPGPRPQTGVGRRTAPSKPGKVNKTLVDAMIEKVKMRLLEGLSGANYSTILNAVLEGKPFSTKQYPKPVKVVIVSTWRSGSTFTEELLSSHPAVFDLYEPLLMFQFQRLRAGHDAEAGQKVIQNLLECKYREDDYLKTMKRLINMVQRNRELYQVCNTEDHGLDLCYNLEFLSTACKVFPWMLMKIVRMQLSLMEPFLDNPTHYGGLQVIYLVRDPRAVINSRRSTVGWCKKSDCSSPQILCEDMDDNLQTALDFQNRFPGRVHILRYEDMASNPFNMTKKLLDAIGMDYHPKIEQFLSTHTNQEIDTAWTTKRKSKERLMYWTHKLPWRGIEEVQGVCGPVMEKFGYIPVDSQENLKLEHVLRDLPNSL